MHLHHAGAVAFGTETAPDDVSKETPLRPANCSSDRLRRVDAWVAGLGQVLGYAARAVELAEEHIGGSVEPFFLRLLERVRSGSGGRVDAAEAYRTLRSPFTPSAAVLPN